MGPGHFGTSHFVPCREVVLFSELEMYCVCTLGDIGSVLCREVVPFSEGPLLEVPLYYITTRNMSHSTKLPKWIMVIFTVSRVGV